MCGIIGGVSKADIAPLLLEGLKHLQYRGYDSAGIAVVDANKKLHTFRVSGKVQKLMDCIAASDAIHGQTGIAHTRWATHGKPIKRNAHPHIVFDYTGTIGKYIGNSFVWFRPHYFQPKATYFYELGWRKYFSDENTYISLIASAGRLPDIGDLPHRRITDGSVGLVWRF